MTVVVALLLAAKYEVRVMCEHVQTSLKKFTFGVRQGVGSIRRCSVARGRLPGTVCARRNDA